MHTLTNLPGSALASESWSHLKEFRRRFDEIDLGKTSARTALFLLIAFYFVLTAAQTSRHLWHDELFTYYIAQSPSLAKLWQNIHLDLNPPLMYLAERVSLKTFGDNLYSARIPSILGFLLGSLCLYKFVADRLRPSYGILAVTVFWATPFLYFATEARPYGLVIGFFGLAMVAWQKAIEPSRPRWSVWLLAFAVVGMMCSHVLALIYIIPFCVVELARWLRTRRFDFFVWASLLLPSVILLVYIPLMSRYSSSAFPATTQATPAKIIGFFYRMLEPQSLFLLIALSLGLLAGFRRGRSRDERFPFLSTLEWIFAWSLLFIPVLVNIAMMRSHGIAYPRYSGPAVLLFGILFAVFLAMQTKASRFAAVVASAVLLLYVAGSNVGAAKSAVRNIRAGSAKASSPFVDIHPELPLVMASGINFFEMDKYYDSTTVERLYYLTGRDLALKYAHATIFEGLTDLKANFPIRAHVEPYYQFTRVHPRFLALGQVYYPEDWLLRRLLDIHASLQYLGDYSGLQLYLVTMPGQPILETGN